MAPACMQVPAGRFPGMDAHADCLLNVSGGGLRSSKTHGQDESGEWRGLWKEVDLRLGKEENEHS